MRCRSFRLISTTCAICFLIPFSSAAIIYVNLAAAGSVHDGASWQTAFLSVPDGVHASHSGDEVWVAQGTYGTGLDSSQVYLVSGVGLYGGFAGTESGRTQRNFAANPTIISVHAGSVVVVPSGAGTDTVLDGFTLTGGTGQSFTVNGVVLQYGGGVYSKDASPTISNNTITQNAAVGYCNTDPFHPSCSGGGLGGGIYCENGSPVIVNNVISQNSSWSGGGGIMTVGGTPAIVGNTISGNQSVSQGGGSGPGGGVACNGSTAVILNNTFTNNVTGNFGGGVSAQGGSVAVSGNTFTDNNAANGGGGIYLQTGVISANSVLGNRGGLVGGGIDVYGAATVSRNRVRWNAALNGAGIYGSANVKDNFIDYNVAGQDGGGIYTGGIAGQTIVNNTLVGNSARRGGALVTFAASVVSNNIAVGNSTGFFQLSGAAPAVKDNRTFNNGPYSFGGVFTGAAGTNGNIEADPQLVNTAFGNDHIQPTSPCRDAGDDSVVQAGDVDIDGQARIQGAHVDIGADESDGTVQSVLPPRIVRVKPTGDDGNDGSSWDSARKTVQGGISALGPDGGEVWIAQGTYGENVTLSSRVYLYGGFAGTETSRDARAGSTSATILDGGQNDRVALISPNATDCGLDGLTLRNGKPGVADSHGGGLLVRNAGVIVNNCAITGNAASTGAGISAESALLFLTKTSISANSATFGGGLATDSSFLSVSFNSISGNQANSGGGVYSASTTGILTDNVISQNSETGSPTYSDGGGVFVGGNLGNSSGTLLFVAGNLVAGNTAGTGGGVYLQGGHYASVVNNTVVGNSVVPTQNSVATGGIWCNAGGYNVIENNVVAFNSSGIGFSPSGDAGSLTHNDVYSNGTRDWYGVEYTGYPVPPGNLSSDPMFVDRTGGDYHLQPGSPAIDAGDDTAVTGLSTDLDGKPRILGAHVDIGAYETGTAPFTLADAAHALRIAGGIEDGSSGDVSRLNVETATPGVTAEDAVRITRKSAGLDTNP